MLYICALVGIIFVAIIAVYLLRQEKPEKPLNNDEFEILE